MRSTFVVSALLFVPLFAIHGAAASSAQPSGGSLEGKWAVVRGERNGKPLTEAVRKTCFVTFRGEWMTFIGWDGEIIHEEGKFVLRSEENRKAIDVHDQAAKKVSLGIYALDGNRLTLCLAVGAKTRPQDFKGGPGRSLLVLQRFEP